MTHPQTSHTLAAQLARYAHELRYEDLDPETVEAVKARLVDSIGCAMAAHDEPVVRRCRELAQASSGPCSVIGSPIRTSMEMAAFANGAAIRYLDMNDTHLGPGDPAHPSDNLSACLAAAQHAGTSGRALIVAAALAYEINCRLCDPSRLIANGWDYTLLTLPASALAAGKLLGLDAGQLEQAVNLSLVANIPTFQTRVQTLSDWKGLANAYATRNAVFAVLLARLDMTGPAPIFGGTHGIFRQLGATYSLDTTGFGGRGGRFMVNGTSIKRYPAEFFSLTAIEAAIGLRTQAGDVDSIQSIDVETTGHGFRFLGSEPEKWHPKSRDAADHSLPYLVARAFVEGDITLGSCSPAAIADERVQRLMAKVTVREAADLTALYPAKVANRLSLQLADGRRLVSQVDDLPGFPGRVMGRGDVERKFHANAGRAWPQAQRVRVLDLLWSLEDIANVSSLFEAWEPA